MKKLPVNNDRSAKLRGWVFIDVLMGMILVSLIAVMLDLAVGWHNRALAHLADTRAATRLAESTLFSLESGQAPTPSEKINIRKLESQTTIPGKSWVEVEVAVNNHRASLIGLAPQNAMPSGGNP
jgi:Tfp pilus assembly protein PilX